MIRAAGVIAAVLLVRQYRFVSRRDADLIRLSRVVHTTTVSDVRLLYIINSDYMDTLTYVNVW